MKILSALLQFLIGSIFIMCSCFAWSMVAYIIKYIKWDKQLKRYKVKPTGEVVNPQGFVLVNPKQLLDELRGIEERIAK